MTATNYLDYAGLQRFKTKLDAQYADIYRTEAQVNSQIDTKLATYSQSYVQISSDVPTIAGGAQEGIIYLVPDGNAPQGSFKYIAYAVEEVSGTPTVVKLGTGTTEIPIVDQTVVEDSQHAVSGGAVFDELALKVNTADVTGSVTQNDTNPVTSGGVYTELTTNWVAKNDIASAVTASDTTHVVTGDAVATYVTTELGSYVTSASIAGTVTDGDSNVVSGDAVHDFVTSELGSYVTTASIAATVTDDDANVVSGDAVYEFVTSQISNIQSITNPEIDVMFIVSGEIWIDGTGWATMKAKFDSAGEFVPLTKNSSGYYVIKPADVTGTVNTLVLATSDDSISTGALTDVTSASDLAGLAGKIVAAADQATALTILA